MDCEGANENDADPHAEKSEEELRETMKDDFSRVFPNWLKFCFKTKDEWKFLFPVELESVEGTSDLVNDLMTIHVGRIYDKATKMKNKDGDLLFGNLPLMASCSMGRIGALMAESFCERCISVSNMVSYKLNRNLCDEEVQILVMAKMNNHFWTL